MVETQLSAAEAELYDRQIRLWGFESQQRLRAANVLLIGIRGLGSEIAKNILLSGINSLTILDNGIVTKEDQMTNFLLYPESVGKKIVEEVLVKAQALNPLVKIVADSTATEEKELQFYEQFTLVIATGLKTDLLFKINKHCHSNNVKFISGDVFGSFAYSISDLQEHTFIEERGVLPPPKRIRDHQQIPKPATNQTIKIETTYAYPELRKVLVLPDSKQTVEKKRRRNGLFYVAVVLAEFRNRFGRRPAAAHRDADAAALQQIREQVAAMYDAPPARIRDEWFAHVYDQVAPVCAVLGGVVAQEAIKAMSHREVPIRNVFLFDPVVYAGREEAVGL